MRQHQWISQSGMLRYWQSANICRILAPDSLLRLSSWHRPDSVCVLRSVAAWPVEGLPAGVTEYTIREFRYERRRRL